MVLTAGQAELLDKILWLKAELAAFLAIPVTTGVQALEVDLGGKSKDVKSFLVTVEYTDGGGNTLHGSLLISN